MKKTTAIVLAFVLLITLAIGIGPASASLPSAKVTAQIAELAAISESQVVSDEDPDWTSDLDLTLATNILTQTIKTANDKDLFIDVSLLSGLYTKTNVKSKGGNKDTSAAAAAVLLKVEVDGTPAFPGWIVYNGRVQVLSATLQGIIDTVDLGTGIPNIGDPEEIGLIIGTLSANSFNFIVADLSSGMHDVDVSALLVTFAGAQSGSAKAVAVIGLGSVTIEEVRMVKGENWLMP